MSAQVNFRKTSPQKHVLLPSNLGSNDSNDKESLSWPNSPTISTFENLNIDNSRSPSAPPTLNPEPIEPITPEKAKEWIKNYNRKSCEDKLPENIYDSCKSIARVDINGNPVASGVMISEKHLLTVQHSNVENINITEVKILFGYFEANTTGEHFDVEAIISPGDPSAVDLNLATNKNSDLILLKLKQNAENLFPGTKYGFKNLEKIDLSRLPDSLYFLGYSNGGHLKISEMNVRPKDLKSLISEIKCQPRLLEKKSIFWNGGQQCGKIISIENTISRVFIHIELISGKHHFLFEQNGILYSGKTDQPIKSDIFVGFNILFGEDHIIISHKIFSGGSGGVFLTNSGSIYAVLMGKINNSTQHFARIPTVPSITALYDSLLVPEASKSQEYGNKKSSYNTIQLYIYFILKIDSNVLDIFKAENVVQIIQDFQNLCPSSDLKTLWDEFIAEMKPSLQEFTAYVKQNENGSKFDAFIGKILFAREEVEFLSKSKIDFARKVKIGTEFTFSGEKTYDKLIEDESKWAKPIIKEWKDAVQKSSKYKEKLEIIVNRKGKSSNSFTFNYTFGGRTWYWILDCDEGCIETQTFPTVLQDFNKIEIETIIREDIFATAATLNLKPDTTFRGGGGHLSFDCLDLFGNSSRLFLGLLNFFNRPETSAYWDNFFNYPSEDRYNANWWSTLECDAKKQKGTDFVNNLLSGCREKYLEAKLFYNIFGFENLDFILPELKKLTLPIAIQEENKDATSFVNQQSLHYHAINLTHVFEKNGRIEFRRISAQNNFDEFKGQIKFIFLMFKESYKKEREEFEKKYPDAEKL